MPSSSRWLGEVAIDDRLIDIVAEGYDAGVRLTEAIERDMVQVRLTDPFRFVVVGAPSYLARSGAPESPKDLLQHECITFRSQTTGALYAWELERGRRTWRVPVRGGVVVANDAHLIISLAEQGLGLAYTFEPMVAEQLRRGRLKRGHTNCLRNATYCKDHWSGCISLGPTAPGWAVGKTTVRGERIIGVRDNAYRGVEVLYEDGRAASAHGICVPALESDAWKRRHSRKDR